MSNQREVLIVDDQQVNTRVLELLFKINNPEIRITSFNSPYAALTHLQAHDQPPGAMIVDFNMPGMNGDAFIAEAYKHLSDQTPPNFLYTSNPAAAREAIENLGITELGPITQIFDKTDYESLIAVVANIIHTKS